MNKNRWHIHINFNKISNIDVMIIKMLIPTIFSEWFNIILVFICLYKNFYLIKKCAIIDIVIEIFVRHMWAMWSDVSICGCARNARNKCVMRVSSDVCVRAKSNESWKFTELRIDMIYASIVHVSSFECS